MADYRVMAWANYRPRQANSQWCNWWYPRPARLAETAIADL